MGLISKIDIFDETISLSLCKDVNMLLDMNNVYRIDNELYRSTGYFAFACRLRLNLRHPRHSFEDMTHLPNMDRQSTIYA